eukprot:TRINITY_DN2918_c0_g1_i8.p1 TRINITY_DN2918_c0_g1~~TRINITY_DN2918_c0_g1_i8.p1  ORF type:complete len:249 (-),score=47.45 TRINITY_DN2918_c0_g1_i8:25-771(-)
MFVDHLEDLVKVRTTNPLAFSVKPNQGVLGPEGTTSVRFQASTYEIDLNQSNDKFLVQALKLSQHVEQSQIPNVWRDSDERNREIQSIKLGLRPDTGHTLPPLPTNSVMGRPKPPSSDVKHTSRYGTPNRASSSLKPAEQEHFQVPYSQEKKNASIHFDPEYEREYQRKIDEAQNHLRELEALLYQRCNEKRDALDQLKELEDQLARQKVTNPVEYQALTPSKLSRFTVTHIMIVAFIGIVLGALLAS